MNISKYVAHYNLRAKAAAAAAGAAAALVTATTDVGSGQSCFVAVSKWRTHVRVLKVMQVKETAVETKKERKTKRKKERERRKIGRAHV